MSNKRECLCSGCKRRFTSVTAFDKHQTGPYRRGLSRCMSDERMRAAGLEQDAASGLWRVKQGRNMQAWLERKRDQARQSREQQNAPDVA